MSRSPSPRQNSKGSLSSSSDPEAEPITAGRLSTEELDRQFCDLCHEISDATMEENQKKLFAQQDNFVKDGQAQASKVESYAQRIIMQQDNRDALTAATQEKMAKDAAALAEIMRQRGAIKKKVEGVACSNRYDSDGVYRNLPRVKAKLEVLKGLRYSFLNGDTDHDQTVLNMDPPTTGEERAGKTKSLPP